MTTYEDYRMQIQNAAIDSIFDPIRDRIEADTTLTFEQKSSLIKDFFIKLPKIHGDLVKTNDNVLKILTKEGYYSFLTNSDKESIKFSYMLGDVVQNLLVDNKAFTDIHGKDYFDKFSKGQTPRMTIVSCSDSRVQTNGFDQTADNDIFMIRNIGNSFENTQGSIEYGVLHLKTPILIFIGHSECGAVKAALSEEIDWSELEPAIKEELQSMRKNVDKTKSLIENIKLNVENQASAAADYFQKKFNEFNKDTDPKLHLIILRAIYDFTNVLEKGYGRLTFLDKQNDLKTANSIVVV